MKLVFRRYAGLYFILGLDHSDNELAYLEIIHLFVECLDDYFSTVCELDLVYTFYKVFITFFTSIPFTQHLFCDLPSASFSLLFYIFMYVGLQYH